MVQACVVIVYKNVKHNIHLFKSYNVLCDTVTACISYLLYVTTTYPM